VTYTGWPGETREYRAWLPPEGGWLLVEEGWELLGIDVRQGVWSFSREHMRGAARGSL
jgi:hypothetical protein